MYKMPSKKSFSRENLTNGGRAYGVEGKQVVYLKRLIESGGQAERDHVQIIMTSPI